MSILTTCPECDSTYKVKDALRGKRIRCRKCQSPVLVDPVDQIPDLSGLETSADLDVWEETRDEIPLRRLGQTDRGQVSGVSFGQRMLAQMARSPWIGLGLVFFGMWVPFSLVESKFVMVLNIILLSVAGLGCIVGMVLDHLKVKFDNPLDVLNAATFGAVAKRMVSPETLAFGREPQDRNGRRMTRHFGILTAALMVHALLLIVLRQQQVLS